MEESREQRGLGHCRHFDIEAVKQHLPAQGFESKEIKRRCQPENTAEICE
jgi:hypothetical protein